MEEEEDEEFISLSDGSGGAEVPLSLQDLEAALTALQYRRSVLTFHYLPVGDVGLIFKISHRYQRFDLTPVVN